MDISLKTGVVLFVLGLAGVFSLLTATIPIELPPEVTERFTTQQLKWLLLINPVIFLTISVALGIAFAHKSGLRAPLIESFFRSKDSLTDFFPGLKIGAASGLLAGIVVGLFSWALMPFLPPEMQALEQKMEVPFLVKFLYGGITEEVLMRWGWMSLLVWLGWKIFRRKSEHPTDSVFWVAIFISAVIFGLGHLPLVFSALGADAVTPLLISYIIVGNSVVGILAGWLFWKKGLEAAMLAHIFAHIGMMTVAYFQS